jgi:hypothetical protein
MDCFLVAPAVDEENSSSLVMGLADAEYLPLAKLVLAHLSWRCSLNYSNQLLQRALKLALYLVCSLELRSARDFADVVELVVPIRQGAQKSHRRLGCPHPFLLFLLRRISLLPSWQALSLPWWAHHHQFLGLRWDRDRALGEQLVAQELKRRTLRTRLTLAIW